MPSRLQQFNVYPWTGGLVTSLDQTLIQPNQLTRADNVIFSTQGTRLKREGIDADFDSLNIATVSRSSTGTTRTIVTTGHNWAVGEVFTLTGMGNSNYNNANCIVSSVSTTTTTNDTIAYTFSGAASLSEGSTADTSGTASLQVKIISMLDYWYGSTSAKTHYLMAFTSNGRLIEINLINGERRYITDTGTAYTIPVGGIKRACMVVFDNRLMVAAEGTSNVMKHYFPTAVGGSGNLEDVTNTSGFAATPKASFLQVHLGRVWCNDDEYPDRLHYCETGIYNVWQGAGDSGAIDIGPGDGDPEGLTAIFPPFKGVMFVAKRTKLYKVSGTYPEDFYIDRVASSLGCVSHQAVAAVDQDDVLFVSDKGVHSSITTDQYGDFQQAFLSADIQTSVVETWNRLRQKYIQAAYIPQINSVAFCVSEGSVLTQTDIWFYNVPLKQWYRWPDIDCQSICAVNDIDKQRFYLGQTNGRVAKAFNSLNYDISASGAQTGITMTLATGLIYPSGNLMNVNGYKRLGLVYKPVGTYTFTASIKIDNFSTQTVSFSDSSGSDLLGSTFTLGQSELGSGQVASTYISPIDGYGRGFKLTVTQSGIDQFGELLGFVIFFEPSEPVNETRAGDNG